jgi:hypothetical protein
MFTKHGNVVTPIYLERIPGKLEHLGSGVLLQFKEGHFLFTAAHVLAEKVNGQILLPGTPVFLTPRGNIISSCQLLPEVAQRDTIDLSYIQLDVDEVKMLKDCGSRFLQVTLENFEPTGSAPLLGMGTVSGYPCSAVTITGNKAEIHYTDLVEMQFAPPARIRRAGLNPETTIGLIRHQKLFLDGKRLHEFELRGMSGGAIWAHDNGHVRLVGIFTEYHSSRALLIGTRLKPLIEELVRRFRQP